MSSAPWAAPPLISSEEFSAIQELARASCGLDLSETKRDLVAVRLERKMRGLRLSTFHEYYSYVVEDRTGEALVEFIDTLTTNHTSFLREPSHFQVIRDLVGAPARRGKSFRIWSAACSSGEEPYSIAMTLVEADRTSDNWSILATDISSRILGTAKKAAYHLSRVADAPNRWKSRFFQRGHGAWKDWLRVRREVTERVRFERLNLLDDFSRLGTFETILCRNVMIYFDRKTRDDLVDRLASQLAPGGLLFVGHSESLMSLPNSLESAGPAAYRRK